MDGIHFVQSCQDILVKEVFEVRQLSLCIHAGCSYPADHIPAYYYGKSVSSKHVRCLNIKSAGAIRSLKKMRRKTMYFLLSTPLPKNSVSASWILI